MTSMYQYLVCFFSERNRRRHFLAIEFIVSFLVFMGLLFCLSSCSQYWIIHYFRTNEAAFSKISYCKVICQ